MNQFSYYYKCDCGRIHRRRGHYTILQLSANQEELRISGNGKEYHVITGHSTQGCFLCIPIRKVACPFDVSEIDKLSESLGEHMGIIETSLIKYALKKFYGKKKA